MTDAEKVTVLAAAVAGLLHEVGDDAVRLGADGYIVGCHDGVVVVDGEAVASDVQRPTIVYFGEEEPRP